MLRGTARSGEASAIARRCAGGVARTLATLLFLVAQRRALLVVQRRALLIVQRRALLIAQRRALLIGQRRARQVNPERRATARGFVRTDPTVVRLDN